MDILPEIKKHVPKEIQVTLKDQQTIKGMINSISPSFCVAKWSQVTLHLHNGRTHSCHHPATHPIPLDELAADHSALHNTCYKKSQRKLMRDGQRPSECQYCWNVEDLPSYDSEEFYSDRVSKSASLWSMDMFHEAAFMPWDTNVNPRYVEVSFSNVCNFKCSYCSPVYSSRWVEEIDTHGPYPTSGKFNNLDHLRASNQMPIHHKAHNPYVEAFWKWWPELVKTLKVFRITGGEPLLSDDTFKVLDFLSDNPQPELDLAVNTNGCVPDKKFDEFINKIRGLLEGNKIKSFQLFTSVEGTGKAAEYGRFGLDYNKWYRNIDRFLQDVPKATVFIMSTVNMFSITTYASLMREVLALKTRHGPLRIGIDIVILRFPHHQCVNIVHKDCHYMMQDALDFMKKHSEPTMAGHFLDIEISKMERLIHFMYYPPHVAEGVSIDQSRVDFVKFVDEHDRRRNTNFHTTFPELKEFYELCKSTQVSKGRLRP